MDTTAPAPTSAASQPSAPASESASASASASASSSKVPGPKQPKQPKPKQGPSPGTVQGSTGTTGAAGGPKEGKVKEKSAKDAKKEKRAAAVAARGGGEDPRFAQAGAGGIAEGSAGVGTGAGGVVAQPPLNRSTSSVPPSAGAVPPHTAAAGQARRPAPLASEGSYTIPQPSQSLFFSHLPVLTPPQTASASRSGKIHPLVIRLGALTSSGTLRGSNARTTGLLLAFREVVRDYETPENAVLWKDLPGHLSPMIAWLEGCRPKGAGGGNAIRWLKGEINKLGEESEERSEAEQKEHLVQAIGHYIRDRIEFADQIIAREARQKIGPGDVVVTYARSSVVELSLIEAWKEMRREDPQATFEVVVVDSAPLYEGRNLLKALTAHSIPCTYTLLTTLSPLLSRASLVLLGASALYANGSLHSRAGTSLVAMLAKECRVPVVVAVETYKFSDGTRLDGLGMNEVDLAWMGTGLGPGSNSGSKGKDGKGGADANLTRLALSYDLTPAEYITALCTEIGFIPPSSVPTVTGKSSAVA